MAVTDHVLRISVPPDARFVPTVRKRIEQFTRDRRVAQIDIESLVLAVGEALANAVEHSDATHDIEVQCRVDERKIIATIIDSGRGVDRSKSDRILPLPEPMSERGRGIPIMQRCTDMFSIRRLPGGGTGVVLGLLRRIEGNPATP
jgi:serine/threonine-protein kinase RsbW